MNDNLQYDNLQKGLEQHLEMMQQTAQAIMDQDISNYPIFLINETAPALGINIIAFELEGKPGVITATTLEELVTKGIVEMEKVEDFRDVYKKNDHSLCLLIPEAEGATFIFLPKKG